MNPSASKIALAMACEGALVLPQTRVANAYTDDGNAKHEALEAEIVAGRVPDVLELRWPGYTWRSEVAYAVDLATGVGRELGVGIQRDYAAFNLGPFEITGTLDLEGTSPDGAEVVIVDRKGFDPNIARAAHNKQLRTLALAVTRAKGIDGCEVAIWHEVRPLDVARLDLFDIEAFHVELRELLASAAGARQRYRAGLPLKLVPGNQCRWCDAYLGCPAAKALTAEIETGAAEVRVEALIPFGDDTSAAQAWDFLARVNMLAKRLREALYARAAERPIPLGNGMVLGSREKQGSTVIDADIAYAVVRELHGQEAADKSVTRKASQVGIERAVGKPAKKAVMAEIEARGGTSRDVKTVTEVYAPALAMEAAQ